MDRRAELETVLSSMVFVGKHWLPLIFAVLVVVWLICSLKRFYWGWVLLTHCWAFIFLFFSHLSYLFTAASNPELWQHSIGYKNTNFFILFECDAVTLWFFTLVFVVNFLALMSVSIYFTKTDNNKSICHFIFATSLIVLPIFAVTNLLFFYILFEMTIFPIFYIIRKWGVRDRKNYAAFLYLVFSLGGSILLLSGLILLMNMTGSLELETLTSYNFTSSTLCHVAVILMFIGFIIKVPLFPFHMWLPEAHVEAPTAGSVVLAGYLLKLGAFGIYKFIVPAFPGIVELYRSYIFVICCVGILYISVIAFRQHDLKKIIAYSSVIHMAVSIIGLTALKPEATMGAIIFMLSHGLVASAMFISVGSLYSRFHTKNLKEYGGLAQLMPLFSIFFFLFSLANFSFPGSSNFVGEALILVSLAHEEAATCLVVVLSSFFIGVFTMWTYGRVCLGKPSPLSFLKSFLEITKNEIYVLGFCLIGILLIGFCPNILIHSIETDIQTQFVTVLRTGSTVITPMSRGGIYGFFIYFLAVHPEFWLWILSFVLFWVFLVLFYFLSLYFSYLYNWGFIFKLLFNTWDVGVYKFWFYNVGSKFSYSTALKIDEALAKFKTQWETHQVGAWLEYAPPSTLAENVQAANTYAWLTGIFVVCLVLFGIYAYVSVTYQFISNDSIKQEGKKKKE